MSESSPIILCDTCVVLMLLRIAPNMFEDDKYNCVTVSSVHREIKQSSRFKKKYPWRDELVKRVKPGLKEVRYDEYRINIEQDKDEYGLSTSDSIIALTAFENDCRLATHDQDRSNPNRSSLGGLVKCCEESYGIEVVTALDVLNEWVECGVIEVNSELLEILTDWSDTREVAMPKEAARKFEKITGIKFPHRVK